MISRRQCQFDPEELIEFACESGDELWPSVWDDYSGCPMVFPLLVMENKWLRQVAAAENRWWQRVDSVGTDSDLTKGRLRPSEGGPCYCEGLCWILLLEVQDEWWRTDGGSGEKMTVVENRQWWRSECYCYKGQWNECLLSLMDSWGSSGETLEVRQCWWKQMRHAQ
jgi:hypothetical protein